ncbi:intracellular sulfur oxidation protein of DsrH family protein [Psychromonas sp. CNPT3]|uniref:sulfurtransferase complex subunit TusB n=1 Tax=Psychromonas sp. CNPT3 TaxID=314282 RepID=UPI00006E9E56|nr:sulfurtransferase complex subunit TusB [Psychromonas sp. CNPT3]AGH82332.1 intracellular sulfur oxidation protein of DsrH family protein [Psychromonas sp. CNPT3]
MILHSVHTSPSQSLALQQCLALLNDADSLILLEDGVFACHAKHAWYSALEALSEQGRLMVLRPDLEARGIKNKIGKSCSYTDFVSLTLAHKSLIAW